MISTRSLTLPVVLVLLGVCATPAHATLLVRSDSSGLFISDKNGLDDVIEIQSTTLSGATAYRIRNVNNFDIFKFDRQAGCFEDPNSGAVVRCRRDNSFGRVRLNAGNDELRYFSDAPPGLQDVQGGPGNDEISAGISLPNVRAQFFGDAGADDLLGAGAADLLRGGDGNDTLSGFGGNDTVRGENGNDGISGNAGADTLSGDAGNDNIVSKEPGTPGVADEISCGSGSDFLNADLADPIPASCEEFQRSPVGETPHVGVPKRLRVSRNGRVGVRLRCPRGTRGIGCRGSLRLRIAAGAGSSASRRVRYRIGAGRRKTVTLRVTGRDVRQLRSRQRRGRRTQGVLTSVESGRKGRKTTVRRPRLRLG